MGNKEHVLEEIQKLEVRIAVAKAKLPDAKTAYYKADDDLMAVWWPIARRPFWFCTRRKWGKIERLKAIKDAKLEFLNTLETEIENAEYFIQYYRDELKRFEAEQLTTEDGTSKQ